MDIAQNYIIIMYRLQTGIEENGQLHKSNLKIIVMETQANVNQA